MLYLQKTPRFFEKAYKKWARFSNIFSVKYNVFGVLNGNNNLHEKFLAQTISSIKVSIHILPKKSKTSPALRNAGLRTSNLFLYLHFFHVAMVF